MDMGAVMMRATDNSGAVYLPYSFGKSYTEEEKAKVSAFMDTVCPQRVTAFYNNWDFDKGSMGYLASRATWSKYLCSETLDGLIQMLKNYYK